MLKYKGKTDWLAIAALTIGLLCALALALLAHHRPIAQNSYSDQNLADEIHDTQKAANNLAPMTAISNADHGTNSGNGLETKESKWTDPNTWLTFALVVVGALQVWVLLRQAGTMATQATIMNSTLANAAKAAEDQSRDMQASIAAAQKAAEVAERALVELEAPAIFVNIMQPGVAIGQYDQGRYDRRILRYCFVNHGRTAAHIMGYSQKGRALYPGTGSPSPIDIATDFPNEIPHGFVVPPRGGASEEVAYSFFNEIPWGEIEMFDNTSNSVHFLVAARYKDIFGSIYITGFEFKLDGPNGRFVLTSNGSPYNYLEKQKAP